jgi:hypothetical protein
MARTTIAVGTRINGQMTAKVHPAVDRTRPQTQTTQTPKAGRK